MAAFQRLERDNMTKAEIDKLHDEQHGATQRANRIESIYVVGFTKLFNNSAHILTLPDGKLPSGPKSEHTLRPVGHDAYDIAKKAGFMKPSSHRSLHIDRERIEGVHGYSFHVVLGDQALHDIANYVTGENVEDDNMSLELHDYDTLLERIATHEERRYDRAYLRAFGTIALNRHYA